MAGRTDGIAYFALVVAVVALATSLLAYGRSPRLEGAAAPRPAATLPLSMVVATFTGQGMVAHRWYPTMLVARVGDTVDLAVANPDAFAHQLEITGYGLRTRRLAPGASDDLRFVADRPGVFVYRCALPHNPATRDCTPDHEQMRGYLIVTE
ncbi:MAG: hypothetical protein QN173_07880 [Armatimonadota bacterium]|nr:hypothetical protein [Armatimonadota bacterium]MDR7437704.1 hypothetical protein [Armatimonadota bacterium]MDR7472383.1 hypothetical protein [Armatimonadota bacterium]MDR7507507.1 hypothetical protein [Armatimonadota bacterium]MDR7509766.1 hypothetical protein [Armatimonadota bacterium]